MSEQTRTPAGWYPDPAGSAGQRYFDGERWSDHVAHQQPPTPPLPPVHFGAPQ